MIIIFYKSNANKYDNQAMKDTQLVIIFLNDMTAKNAKTLTITRSLSWQTLAPSTASLS